MSDAARDLLARIARTVVSAIRSMQAPDDLPPKTGAKEAKVDETVQVLRKGVIIVKCAGLPAPRGTRVYIGADATVTVVPSPGLAVLGTITDPPGKMRVGDVEVCGPRLPEGCAAVQIGGE